VGSHNRCRVGAAFASGWWRPNAEVTAENGFQLLRSAEDWWIIALGSGLRWVIDQMGPQVAARVKADNVNWLSENKIDRVDINAIYAIGTKSS
jgi:hypothetical protein